MSEFPKEYRTDLAHREHDVVIGRNALIAAILLLVGFTKPVLSFPHALALACYAVYVGLVLYGLWRIARGLAWHRLTVAIYATGILVPFSVIIVNLLLIAAAMRGLDMLLGRRE